MIDRHPAADPISFSRSITYKTNSFCESDEKSRPVRPDTHSIMLVAYWIKQIRRVLADEQGGEVLEYALIAGVIVVATLSVVTKVGTKVLGRWQSLNSSM